MAKKTPNHNNNQTNRKQTSKMLTKNIKTKKKVIFKWADLSWWLSGQDTQRWDMWKKIGSILKLKQALQQALSGFCNEMFVRANFILSSPCAFDFAILIYCLTQLLKWAQESGYAMCEQIQASVCLVDLL